MTCIIVDDEPLAREGMEMLIAETEALELKGCCNDATSAAAFLSEHPVDLVFLDIQMPGMNGLEFARFIPSNTLVIFTTAYAEYALNSYEVDALDYLVKPIKSERFLKAIKKAAAYFQLLQSAPAGNDIESISDDYIFVKAERKFFKIPFRELLFVEGLKDYVVLHTPERKIITAMNIKTIYDQLPQPLFMRVSKSYIVNTSQITSFDNNTVYIQQHEVPIGNTYRSIFLEEVVSKKLLKRYNGG